MTTSRFTRTNQSRTWNTGNGSPDAICFQVDRPGISVAGIGVYGGIGHYEYELELLEEQSSLSSSEGQTHTQRWNSLELTKGSFVPEDFAPDIIEIKFDKAIPIKVSDRFGCTQRTNTFLHRKTLNTPYGSEITVVELTTVTED
jgi:E3 ubiquitin-protein ligase MYCBP2